jgi:2-oxoglutarate/2-oxoacid ferredoxin oxidoreductase subunit beta
MNNELLTNAKNEWCPGCGNFAILTAAKAVISELIQEGHKKEDIVIVSGIGQHAKMVDYINVNSFYALHGRAIAAAEGIKLANPRLKVIVFVGDGDSYGEGLEHLIFAAKRNIDITVIVHNNRVYALTTGQNSPTSPLGYKGRSTPTGSKENPLNPIELMLASGASHIARGYTAKPELLRGQIKEAVLHKGFSIIDTLQICVTFFNMYETYNKKVYELSGNDTSSFEDACRRSREWDYNSDAPISTGTFYKVLQPTFDDRTLTTTKSFSERDASIKELLQKYI